MKWAKVVLHFWRHSQKNPQPPIKTFFQLQTTRLAESFALLTRSVALSGPEKFPCKATCNPAVFTWTAWIDLGAKVLKTKHCYKPKQLKTSAKHRLIPTTFGSSVQFALPIFLDNDIIKWHWWWKKIADKMW